MAEREITIKLRAEIEDLKNKLRSAETQIKASAEGGKRGLRGLETQSKETTRGLGSLAGKVKTLISALAGLVIVRQATRFLMSCVRAAAESERQMSRLQAAVKNVGLHYGLTNDQIINATKSLDLQSRALQSVTGYSDEEIKAAQAMLSTFMLLPSQIQKITPRLLDMAAATEKSTGQSADLQAVAIALGKGFTGMVGSLTRYGVVLSNEAKATGDFNLILRDLDANFKGAAEAVGVTLFGQLRRTREEFNDFKEFLGTEFGPMLTETLLPALRSGAEHLRTFFKALGWGMPTLEEAVNENTTLGKKYEDLTKDSERLLYIQDALKEAHERLTAARRGGIETSILAGRHYKEIAILTQEETHLMKAQTGAAKDQRDKLGDLAKRLSSINFLKQEGIKFTSDYDDEMRKLSEALKFVKEDSVAYAQVMARMNELQTERNALLFPEIEIDRQIREELEGIKIRGVGVTDMMSDYNSEIKKADERTDAYIRTQRALNDTEQAGQETLLSIATAVTELGVVLRKEEATLGDWIRALLSLLAIPYPALRPALPLLQAIMSFLGLEKGGILKMQEGGITKRPTFLLGERGAEIIAPLESFYSRLEEMLEKHAIGYPKETYITLKMEGFANLTEPEVQDKLLRIVINPALERYQEAFVR